MTIEVSDDELVQRFPGEPITHDNAAHYRGRLRRALLLNRCADCGRWHEPARPICPDCWSARVSAEPVSGNGVIFMAIFLHRGPAADGVDYATPYPVVTVELDEQEGLRFTSTVVGAANEDIRIGTPVQLAWVERAGTPLPVFELQAR
ncbi:hypothetical protein MGALJ_30490 [Mycobacterium gallinarum]|uniref:DNA-binding protein n=2 Tax=Mycobacterium gallinarum TaxID=39689 RepID=A0A9W4B9D1_9MYCO|nr:hypothetical protein MGALJ_30490 [Mycobacterium gallinarum]